MLFMVGLLIPWMIPIGGLNISVYRIALLAGFLPCLVAWLAGKAGKKRLADFAIILFCIWGTASLVLTHGLGASIEPTGILFLETLGAYLLGRVYIRTASDFRKLVLIAATGIILLLPFALIETITGRKLFLDIFGLVFPTIDRADMMRSGLVRVQGPFDHPILFGLNCGSLLALTSIVLADKPVRRLWMTGGVGLTAALSLSSAPIAALVIQTALLGWNWLLNKNRLRWYILLGFLFVGYLVVEFGSNQTPVEFYISHFTFDTQTGWYRLAIWNYGSASVANHPLFGIGLGEWARPGWMHSGSVDNFWLLTAMRHGIPALLLLWLAMLAIAVGLVSAKNLTPTANAYRTGVLMCLTTYLFVGSTVHLWNSAYAWFFFLLGSSVWLLDAKNTEGETEVPGKADARPARRYGREPAAQARERAVRNGRTPQ